MSKQSSNASRSGSGVRRGRRDRHRPGGRVAGDPAARSVAGTVAEEHARLAAAIRRATCGVEELVRLLPRSEAELFEPEVAILGELGP